MPKFTILTPKGASFTVAGGGYGYEMEALEPIGAEIVEAPANEAEFIAAAKTADAIYGKGMRITKPIIDALQNCKVITLGTVGVDSVDVKAATARGIPVTNVPDTFIEEVADHAMTLLLAGFRRLVAQDRMVREGRWSEGRPQLLKIPRLMGQTLGFICRKCFSPSMWCTSGRAGACIEMKSDCDSTSDRVAGTTPRSDISVSCRNGS